MSTPTDDAASAPAKIAPGYPTDPGRPRWATVTLVLLAVVVIVVVLAQVLGGTGGQHGPGRHTPAAAAVPVTEGPVTAGAPASASLHVPPAGDHR